MAKKTMRRFLRKPSGTSKGDTNWKALYKRALKAASHLDLESDPRVQLLKGGKDFPERTLKRLSIISVADIEREFGGTKE